MQYSFVMWIIVLVDSCGCLPVTLCILPVARVTCRVSSGTFVFCHCWNCFTLWCGVCKLVV